MNRSILAALAAASMLAPSGCTLFAERTHELVWAKMGTPARIVDEEPVRVMVPRDDGTWSPMDADLSGMVAIDEPTLEHYQALDEAARAKK